MALPVTVAFKASLLNPVGGLFDYTLSSDCLTLTFKDYSNYATTDEAGHTQAYFTDYRTVTITHHTGIENIYSSRLPLADPNYIAPAATMVSNNLVATLTEGDGVYTVKIVTVPTWNIAIQYTVNDCVWYSGELYLCIVQNTGVAPDTDITKWTLIEESEVKPKYYDVNYVLALCDVEDCEATAVLTAVIEMECGTCTDNILCKSPKLLKATKILMWHKAAQINFDRGSYDCAGKNIDNLKILCQC